MVAERGWMAVGGGGGGGSGVVVDGDAERGRVLGVVVQWGEVCVVEGVLVLELGVMTEWVDDEMPGVQVLDKGVDVKAGGGKAALFHSALEGGVVAVLDRVVCAAGEHVGNSAPLVPQGGVQAENCAVLGGGPVLLLEVRVELIDPALAGLLAGATRKVGGDGAPVLGAVARDEVDEQAVLVDAPRTADGTCGRVVVFVVMVVVVVGGGVGGDRGRGGGGGCVGVAVIVRERGGG